MAPVNLRHVLADKIHSVLPFANIIKMSTASMHNLVNIVILGGILNRENRIARERQCIERATGFHRGTAFFCDMDWRESEKSSKKKSGKIDEILVQEFGNAGHPKG